jgi:hypothetical protein
MVETTAKATVVRERFPNCLGSWSQRETKAKAINIRERFHNYQALEGKENGRDHGKGCKRLGKVP